LWLLCRCCTAAGWIHLAWGMHLRGVGVGVGWGWGMKGMLPFPSAPAGGPQLQAYCPWQPRTDLEDPQAVLCVSLHERPAAGCTAPCPHCCIRRTTPGGLDLSGAGRSAWWELSMSPKQPPVSPEPAAAEELPLCTAAPSDCVYTSYDMQLHPRAHLLATAGAA
jgi:hypothetical protein